VYVTHDQVEAMGLGDRVAVLNNGQIQQLGTPEEVYVDPANTFVATFVGAPPMNLLHVRDEVIGFRPENLLPVESVGEHEGQMVCEFEITRVENLGSDRYVYGTIPKLDPEAKVIAKLPSTLDVSVRPGARERYAVDGSKLRWFHPETGQRVEPPRAGLPQRADR